MSTMYEFVMIFLFGLAVVVLLVQTISKNIPLSTENKIFLFSLITGCLADMFSRIFFYRMSPAFAVDYADILLAAAALQINKEIKKQCGRGRRKCTSVKTKTGKCLTLYI